MQSARLSEVTEYANIISYCSFLTSEHACPGGTNAAYLVACELGGAVLYASESVLDLPAGTYAVLDGHTSFTVSPRPGGRVFLLPVTPDGPLIMNTAMPLCHEGMLLLYILRDELLQRKPGYRALAAGLIIRLLGETIMKRGDLPAKDQAPSLNIGDIREYIAVDSADASLRAVAAHFYYHPNTLSRFIRRECGKSFTDLSREVRMEKASVLLLETSLPVCKIAELCGYRNMTHFYKLFYQEFEKTPDQCRRESRSRMSCF